MRTLSMLSAGILLASLTALHATEAPVALRNKLVGMTQAWVDAIPRGDKKVWQETLTDDAVLIDEFGRIQHKADAIASLQKFPAGLSGSIELRNPQVQQHGDAALLQVEEYERESVFGQSLVVRYQALLAFVNRHGAWKLAAAEDVTIPTPPPRLTVAHLELDDYTGSYRYAPDRAWKVSVQHGVLGYTTRAGRPFNALQPIARDVFMGTDDEKNLLIFRRDQKGQVNEVIERRKFNDLHLVRDKARG